VSALSLLRAWIASAKTSAVPSGGTTERTVKSGVWAVATNGLTRSLYFDRLIVLAALLAPADFGLMGIATLTLAALDQLTRLGVDQALVQHTETDVDRFLDTAWTAKLVRGILIAVGLYRARRLSPTSSRNRGR
jgi:PST family polysaccharide transporter/lipopolysaccharide exporter